MHKASRCHSKNNIIMKNQLFKNIKESVNHWYLQLIVGIIMILTAIWTFKEPASSYLALSIVFTISFLVSGISEVIFAITNRKTLDGWGWTLVFGLLSIAIGVMLVRDPAISLLTLPFYVGFMLLFRSFGAIGTAFDLKNYGVMEWGTLLALGILGAIFSFILLWNPLFAGMTIVFWTGILFLTLGIFYIYLSLKMRNLHKSWENVSADLKVKFHDLQAQISKELSK